MTTRQTIMFVDDEKNILHIIRRELFDAPFNILLAGSAQEGLELLKSTPIDMVVSDICMVGMDGLRFLVEVKRKYPDIIRTVLSGHLEENLVLSAITKGISSAFFSKPWDPDQFRQDCSQMLASKKILNDSKLLAIINSIGTMPSLPQVYFDFLSAIDEGVNPRQLAEILGQDATMAVNILHMANTAYFSAYKISSLERALIQLGTNIIKNTVLTLLLARQFPWTREQEHEIQKLLTHSSLVSRLTSVFHQKLYLKNLDALVNSAALTHDIGKIFLLYYFPDSYFKTKKLMQDEAGLSFRDAEIRINQHHITHCEIGAYFMSIWNLASPNIEAALFHHSPQALSGRNARLIQLISLANLRANQPESFSGEEWLDLTREMPFNDTELTKLWQTSFSPDIMENENE